MLNERRDFGLVAFDMDGVLVDYESSWTWVHDHFGVKSEESIKAFVKGEIDDMEFMRRDIALWLGKKPNLCLSDINAILDRIRNAPDKARQVLTEARNDARGHRRERRAHHPGRPVW